MNIGRNESPNSQSPMMYRIVAPLPIHRIQHTIRLGCLDRAIAIGVRSLPLDAPLRFTGLDEKFEQSPRLKKEKSVFSSLPGKDVPIREHNSKCAEGKEHWKEGARECPIAQAESHLSPSPPSDEHKERNYLNNSPKQSRFAPVHYHFEPHLA